MDGFNYCIHLSTFSLLGGRSHKSAKSLDMGFNSHLQLQTEQKAELGHCSKSANNYTCSTSTSHCVHCKSLHSLSVLQAPDRKFHLVTFSFWFNFGKYFPILHITDQHTGEKLPTCHSHLQNKVEILKGTQY